MYLIQFQPCIRMILCFVRQKINWSQGMATEAQRGVYACGRFTGGGRAQEGWGGDYGVVPGVSVGDGWICKAIG